jgi:hypothetical protein
VNSEERTIIKAGLKKNEEIIKPPNRPKLEKTCSGKG